MVLLRFLGSILLSRRIRIQVQRGIRVCPQDARRAGGRNRPVQRCFDCGGLARSRHRADDRPGAAQRGNRERQRAARDVVEGREATIINLLPAAGLVEFHDFHQLRILEISHRRIVEREVPVLADAEADEVRRRRREQRGVAPALGCRVRRLAGQRMERRDPHARKQMFVQIAATTPDAPS